MLQFSASRLSSAISSSSYAIGPFASEDVVSMSMILGGDDEPAQLLIPCGDALPVSLLADSLFRDGAECGYESGWDEEVLTSLEVVNRVGHTFRRELFYGSDLPFVVGDLVGSLSAWAEQNAVFALVGLRHLCYLVSCYQAPLEDWNRANHLTRARFCHDASVAAYRDRVRLFRQQGLSFEDAQHAALYLDAEMERVA